MAELEQGDNETPRQGDGSNLKDKRPQIPVVVCSRIRDANVTMARSNFSSDGTGRDVATRITNDKLPPTPTITLPARDEIMQHPPPHYALVNTQKI